LGDSWQERDASVSRHKYGIFVICGGSGGVRVARPVANLGRRPGTDEELPQESVSTFEAVISCLSPYPDDVRNAPIVVVRFCKKTL
jgi:hypothetical protein